MHNFVKGMGGIPQAREALDRFRAKTRKAGLPGLHLNVILAGKQVDRLTITALGLDSATTYNWTMHLDMPQTPATPYPSFAKTAAKFSEDLRRQCPVPYYPNVVQGYDSSPRTRQTDPLKNQGYPFQKCAR